MMKRLRRRATLLLCALTAASFAGSAMARPVHKAATPVQAVASAQDSRSPDAQPYPTEGVQPAVGKVTKSRGQHGRVGHTGDAVSGAVLSWTWF
jgi:hypothetical protein